MGLADGSDGSRSRFGTTVVGCVDIAGEAVHGPLLPLSGCQRSKIIL